MAQEIDERLKKFLSYPGVIGHLIINHEGIPVKTSLTDSVAIQYAALVTRFASIVRKSVRQMDNSNQLVSVRLRSKSEELIIIPEREFTVVLVQKPVNLI